MDISANSLSGFQLALAVRIGGILHAIPIQSVEEVLPALPIEIVPQCPSYLRGVVFVRGQLIPVLDAAERLGIRNHVRVSEPPIVCLRVETHLVGLEVDEAVDLIDVPRTLLAIEDVNIHGGFLSGFVEQEGQLIRILNVERMIAQQEADELKSLAGMVAADVDSRLK